MALGRCPFGGDFCALGDVLPCHLRHHILHFADDLQVGGSTGDLHVRDLGGSGAACTGTTRAGGWALLDLAVDGQGLGDDVALLR